MDKIDKIIKKIVEGHIRQMPTTSQKELRKLYELGTCFKTYKYSPCGNFIMTRVVKLDDIYDPIIADIQKKIVFDRISKTRKNRISAYNQV